MRLNISLAPQASTSHHHIRNTCPQCHTTSTCRCTKPKIETHDLCSTCRPESTSAAKPNQVSVNLTIEGGAECVDRLLSLIGMLQYNGNVGHSGIFAIPWDGDGADRIKVKGDLPNYVDAWSEASSYGGYAEMVGNNGSTYIISGNGIKQKHVYPLSGKVHVEELRAKLGS
jgi:hypothetical protein